MAKQDTRKVRYTASRSNDLHTVTDEFGEGNYGRLESLQVRVEEGLLLGDLEMILHKEQPFEAPGYVLPVKDEAGSVMQFSFDDDATYERGTQYHSRKIAENHLMVEFERQPDAEFRGISFGELVDEARTSFPAVHYTNVSVTTVITPEAIGFRLLVPAK